MARGPLPDPNRRRRNEPVIPTTSLPAGGRKGRAPAAPDGYRLKKAGRAWWNAAWKTPQATSWDAGSMHTVIRRATLEDDLATLDDFDPLNLAALLEIEESERVRELGFIIGRLKGLAGGRLAVMKEMRELDRQLGLGPKALADLRWTIVAEEDQATATSLPKPAAAKGKGKRRAKKGQPAPGDLRRVLTGIDGGLAATK